MTQTERSIKMALLTAINFTTALAITVWENRPQMCPRGSAYLAYQDKGVDLDLFCKMEHALVESKLVHATSEYLVWVGPDNWRIPPLFELDDEGRVTTRPWPMHEPVADTQPTIIVQME